MMKYDLLSIRDWLIEQKKSKDDRTYGCIMLGASIKDWKEQHLAGIDEDDLYTSDDDDYGLETEPHITILYGIHEDEMDPTVIRDMMKENMVSCTSMIRGIGIFESDDYDVVKYDVEPNRDLLKYRKLFLKSLPNTQTYDVYRPHMTIAYVKKGLGQKYVKKLYEPLEVRYTMGIYSYHERDDDTVERKRIVVHLRKSTDAERVDLTHS